MNKSRNERVSERLKELFAAETERDGTHDDLRWVTEELYENEDVNLAEIVDKWLDEHKDGTLQMLMKFVVRDTLGNTEPLEIVDSDVDVWEEDDEE